MKKVLVMVLAAAFMLAMYVPASAADYDLYGNARMATFWTDQSEEAGDEDGLEHSLQGNSRIGFTFEEGPIGGHVELGVGSDDVGTRIMAGTVDLAEGELKIGQDYTPINLSYSNQVYDDDAAMLDVGMAWQIREPMIQYSVNGFKIALVENQGGEPIQESDVAVADWETTSCDVDVELPLLEASYHIDMGNMFIDLAAGAQTYEIKNVNDIDGNNEDIDSYALVAGFGGDIDMFYYRLTGFYGQNVNDMGWAQEGLHSVIYDPDNNEMVDSDDFGGAAVLGFNLQNGQSVELGAGYNNGEPDATGAEEDETAVYYANYTLPLTANGNAFIVPEVGYYDYFDDVQGEDEGDMFYAGLKWQVNF